MLENKTKMSQVESYTLPRNEMVISYMYTCTVLSKDTLINVRTTKSLVIGCKCYKYREHGDDIDNKKRKKKVKGDKT